MHHGELTLIQYNSSIKTSLIYSLWLYYHWTSQNHWSYNIM